VLVRHKRVWRGHRIIENEWFPVDAQYTSIAASANGRWLRIGTLHRPGLEARQWSLPGQNRLRRLDAVEVSLHGWAREGIHVTRGAGRHAARWNIPHSRQLRKLRGSVNGTAPAEFPA
jgi:hypothetical protein